MEKCINLPAGDECIIMRKYVLIDCRYRYGEGNVNIPSGLGLIMLFPTISILRDVSLSNFFTR